MLSNFTKKIWFICLCLASLSLAGCFHIPDEDWLPSRNKIQTIQKDDQIEQALNSFIDGIDIVSSQRNEVKDNELDESIPEELSGYTIKTEEENINGNHIDSETGDIITEQ